MVQRLCTGMDVLDAPLRREKVNVVELSLSMVEDTQSTNKLLQQNIVSNICFLLSLFQMFYTHVHVGICVWNVIFYCLGVYVWNPPVTHWKTVSEETHKTWLINVTHQDLKKEKWPLYVSVVASSIFSISVYLKGTGKQRGLECWIIKGSIC